MGLFLPDRPAGDRPEAGWSGLDWEVMNGHVGQNRLTRDKQQVLYAFEI